MRRWEKILIVFMLVVIAGFIALGVWQRDNIRAGMMALTKSSEQIAEEMDINKKKLEDELKKKYAGIISDFTAEEEKKIIKGEISVEEAVEELNKKYEESKAESQQNPEDKATGGGNSTNSSTQADAIISDKVVQLYSLKAYYLGQLGQLEASVKSEYSKLPKEKRNLVGKKDLVDKYMGVALGYLESCDQRVAELLTELETELKAIGADVSIIKTIKNAYEEEKTLKKAYYIKLLEE